MNEKSKEYKVKSVHLGNSDDEKLFLTEPEREIIENKVDHKPVSFDYICSNERDYPGLIIYPFAIAVKSQSSETISLGHGYQPTIGYTISFPRSESLKGKTKEEIKTIVKNTKHSYQVNKIHMQLQKLCAYEDYNDDE